MRQLWRRHQAHVMAYGGPNERVRRYGCAKHHDRGSAVCPVTVHQPMDEVESALIDYLQSHVLNDGVLQLVLGEIRNEIGAQLPKREADVVAQIIAAKQTPEKLLITTIKTSALRPRRDESQREPST